ncbi:MAG: amino acid ABC transporter permease [Hyphomicrobiaceae bacterium]
MADVARARPVAPSHGPVAWMRANLFNTPSNAIITLVVVAALVWVLPKLFAWAITDAVWEINSAKCRTASGACWGFVAEKYRLMLFGTYPYAEQWRPLVVSIALVAMVVATLNTRLWGRLLWGAWLIALPVLFHLMQGGSIELVMVILAALGGAVIVGLPTSLVMPAGLGALGLLFLYWALSGLLGLPPLPALPGLFSYVETEKWGGLPLTLILATVGIVCSFPLAVLLALGRRSDLPGIKALCIGFIELVRGVPLITVLFMASLMIPLFLPEGVNFDKLLRAQIGITLFSAAYVAEVIRGGLQAIPKGQYEAADALGLSYGYKTAFVVLPQALKLVIPPLVNTFIGLFKDTSLVIIIGLFDFLGSIRLASNDPEWRAFYVEGLVFAGLVYFVFCYAMALYSRNLEKRLNTGHR